MDKYFDDAVALLRELIAIPRVSREETAAADLMERRMKEWGLNPQRSMNNVWAVCPDYDANRPTLLLNAHIDTVKPVASWTRQPYVPTIEGDRLYGLGANDCGGGLVTLLMTYRRLVASPNDQTTSPLNDQTTKRPNDQTTKRPNDQTTNLSRAYNIIYLASAEEEVSGRNGVAHALPLLPQIDVAVVGEPTGLQPAIAEKGLMVVDGYADGVSGHAAREEGVNAIYEALDDLTWLRDYRFQRVSPLLGPMKMTVTVVESGTQHNVVPDRLHFVLDVRTTELYSNEEVFEFLQSKMKKCRLEARSFRLHSSSITEEHPLVRRCLEMGMKPFGSPTLSDQCLMPFPSLKLGPGQSSRSHSADEFICLSEIAQAMDVYEQLFRFRT